MNQPPVNQPPGPPTTERSPTEPPRRPRPRRNPLAGLFTTLFRLVVLGTSASLAWLTGMAIAQLYPTQVNEPPLSEAVLRGIDQTSRSLRRLTTRDTPTPATPADPADPAPSADPSPTPADAGGVTPASPAPLDLSDDQRQQVETELLALQAELDALSDRTRELEQQVGGAPASLAPVPLEVRLQQVEQRLDPTAVVAAPPSPTPEDESIPVAIADAARSNSLLVTLPSTALFQADDRSLKPAAANILTSIANDLRAYPGALIRVSAHTTSEANATSNRSLSFEQAKAVEQQLRASLGDNYRWVVLGYGDSRPLGEGSNAAQQQRNRRIEIAIEPRR
ncbi:MAG: OmpA family protein [Kaiparowitsia implicata GSE-PSE-MK54-09C]|nr:OmpA family protein [Kaiparowitsia implicata GSE-PSE-MK54-09C]